MASHEQPYDPYLPSGRSGTPGAASYHHEGTDRTAALQAQIDDTVSVMKKNIERTAERGDHVNELEYSAQETSKKAKDFNRGASRVYKKFFFKDLKMTALIIGVIVAVLIIVIALIVHFTKK